MAEPKIYQKGPVYTLVEAGKKYLWCACGLTRTQPFCDNSHKGTEFVPVPYEAKSTKEIAFCGCRHTNNPPLCDGSHSKLG